MSMANQSNTLIEKKIEKCRLLLDRETSENIVNALVVNCDDPMVDCDGLHHILSSRKKGDVAPSD